jgi:uncharacterized membrane protein
MMKIAMHDWPPLFARGCAGLAAALGLAIIAVERGQNLLPSRSLAPRLALGAATNVFAAMGLTALALLWLTVAQAALVTFSMPIWATLLAWPILGERPRLRSVIAMCLGVAGLVLLTGPNLGGGTETFPGVALALAAAILFALGAVTSRAPIPLPPMVSTAWLVGLCSATIKMDARIASHRNAPERVEHCLTRMLPAPRRLVNRSRGLRRLSRRDPAFLFDRRACFPVPTWRCPKPRRVAEGIGRSRATRSHAQRALSREHGEDGEHRTFPEVSTVAHSAPVGGPDDRGSS